MNTLKQIAVLLCVVIIEAQSEEPASTELQEDNYNNRSKREPDLSAYTFPSKCNRAVVSCCAESVQRQKKCFSNFRCALTYDSGTACNKENILRVLDSFVGDHTQHSHSHTRTKRWNYYNENSYPHHQSKLEPDPKQPEQYLPHIVKLLEEIKSYVKTPQSVPVPHPIYVPYPVPYPVSQPSNVLTYRPTTVPISRPTIQPTIRPINQQSPQVTITKVETIKVPNIDMRISASGGKLSGPLLPTGADDKDGARPITFVPIKPDRPLIRRAPKVEHGSVQGDVRFHSSTSQSSPVSVPVAPPRTVQSPCTAAILACCSEVNKQQSNCFYNFQCGLPYDNGNACKSDSIRAALSSYYV